MTYFRSGLVALACAMVASSAGATVTVADFSQLGVKTGVPPKIVYLANQDVLKTTSVTTKTPVYGPTYDKLGHVVGSKIVSYASKTVNSTAITPRAELYSTNGVTTAHATPIVNFNFLVPVYQPYQSLLTGTQQAYFSLDAISTVPAVGFGNFLEQTFDSGVISFNRTTPVQLYSKTGVAIGAPKSNLLTIKFTNAILASRSGSSAFSFFASTPDSTISFSSDFVHFDPAIDYDFAIGFTGASAAFKIAPVSAQLTNVTGQRSLVTTRANAVGNFGAAVPEPPSWGMMIAGFGLVGIAARRRRTAVAA